MGSRIKGFLLLGSNGLEPTASDDTETVGGYLARGGVFSRFVQFLLLFAGHFFAGSGPQHMLKGAKSPKILEPPASTSPKSPSNSIAK